MKRAKNIENKNMKVFISYRRQNGGIAYAYILNDWLTALGMECFFDINTMQDFSDDFSNEIEENIKKSDYVIVLFQDGCLKERNGKDYYLHEIRLAHENNKYNLLLLPVNKEFNFDKEDIPKDLLWIKQQNLCDPLDMSDMNRSIERLVSRMKKDKRNFHFNMMRKFMVSAQESVTEEDEDEILKSRHFTLLQKAEHINALSLKKRWTNSKRISLMALGCANVVTFNAELIEEKINKDDKFVFRILAVDPSGASADDAIKRKVSSNKDGSRNDYLKQNYDTIYNKMKSMPKYDTQLFYRLTSEHITFTMQWVECMNDSDSYIYIEYLPIIAGVSRQDYHPAAIIKRSDPAYIFYKKQFETCWREAAEVKIEKKNKNKNCEFCYPPKKDKKFLLYQSEHWSVYLANNQNYPGRCIIPLRRHCESLSLLTDEELYDFKQVAAMMETVWKEELGATNLNWDCLMNSAYNSEPHNPHVHFHFVPRYDKPFQINNTTFVDTEFGHNYTRSEEFQLSKKDRDDLMVRLSIGIQRYLNQKT